MGIKSMLIALAIPAMSMAAALPQDVNTLIVGGEPANVGDFPHIVSLSRGGSHFCGGSLLNANTVATAAHCAQGQSAGNLRVRAGSLNRNSGGVQVGVSSIRIHPSYSSSSLNNDIAILKLSSPIAASGSTIGYASLPGSGSDPASGSSTTVAGWGATSQSGGSSVTLRKVTVPVVSRASCRSSYGSSAVTDNMFCAGLSQGGKDSCQGDSGGPIVDTSSRTLIGLVSWGEGCAQPNAPGVYARVGSLLPFIQQNL